MAGDDLLCKVKILWSHHDVCNSRQSVQYLCQSIPAKQVLDCNSSCLVADEQQARALLNQTYLSVLNGKFCQKQMPLYNTVCKNPSAALSEIKSSACPLPDCILAFLACTISSSLLTPGKIASIQSGGTVTCKASSLQSCCCLQDLLLIV